MVEVKISYGGLSALSVMYQRMSSLDFGSTKRALTHLREVKKIAKEVEIHDEFVKSFMQRHKLSQGDIMRGDILKEYADFMNEEVSVELEPIDFVILENANLSPLQLTLLEELGLTKLPDEEPTPVQKGRKKEKVK